jgi:transglutaminase-like putative cysteine protease
MRVAIVHETIYRYEHPAHYSVQYLRLTPRSSGRQKVVSWKLETPGPTREWTDAFGNESNLLVVERPHSEIRVRARGEVDVLDVAGPIDDPGPQKPDVYLRTTKLTTVDPSLAGFAADYRGTSTRDRVACLDQLMHAIRERMEYRRGATDSATAAADAFSRRAGVCQDHAHVFVACARWLGIPARYVSGYLAATGGDLASHAWAEAYVDGEGWFGYDVANRTSPAGSHVRVAVGLDYQDACPVRGFRRGGAGESMVVDVRVQDATRYAKQEQEQQQQQ